MDLHSSETAFSIDQIIYHFLWGFQRGRTWCVTNIDGPFDIWDAFLQMTFLHLQLVLESSCHNDSLTRSSPGFAWWLHPCDLQVSFCCSYLTSQELCTVFLSLPCNFIAFGLTFLFPNQFAALSTVLFCSLFGRQADFIINIVNF